MFVIYVCILIKGINYHVFLSFQMCIADFAVKNFKSLPRKKIKELVENMQVLIEGLKPSFLWDICGAHVDELKNFIADLNNALIISESFVLLIINELDYLIGRKSLLMSQIELCFSDQIMFIVSSTKLLCLSSLPNVQSMIQYVRQSLQVLEDGNILELKLDSTWDGSTLFGLACGFPLIYHYHNTEKSDFSSTNLLKVQVKRNEHIVASWTAPVQIFSTSHLAKTIKEDWKYKFSKNKAYSISETTTIVLQSMVM